MLVLKMCYSKSKGDPERSTVYISKAPETHAKSPFERFMDGCTSTNHPPSPKKGVCLTKLYNPHCDGVTAGKKDMLVIMVKF